LLVDLFKLWWKEGGGRIKKEVSGCFGWQGKKKVPDGGGVLRWSEGVKNFAVGLVGWYEVVERS
jgi:hypothetical protein